MLYSHSNGQLNIDFSMKTFHINDNSELIYSGPLEDDLMNKLYKKYNRFDESYSILRQNGVQLLSGDEAALCRTILGHDSLISKNGLYLREGILSAVRTKNIPMIWLRESIVTKLNSVNLAAEANKSGSEYYPQNLEDYMSDLIEGKDYLVLKNYDPIDLFNPGEKGEWLFRENFDSYAKLIVDNTKVRKIMVHKTPDTGSTYKQPENVFASQMYMSNIPQYSSSNMMFIGGGVGDYHKITPLFGIKKETDEEEDCLETIEPQFEDTFDKKNFFLSISGRIKNFISHLYK
ncbi:MAG TPA: hypothetical protein VEC16_06310 [Alphaproteobacteria bacterium]|nr:hypothetical protein [Alphaproteobacteria bacterium]